jgi:DNA-directed RNA polymerase specialized sigma24 family protein
LASVSLLERANAARRLARSLDTPDERSLVLTYVVWPERVPERVSTLQERALALREEGWSLRAIGDVLGVHASTVRAYLTRAGGDPSPAWRGSYVTAGERDERARAAVALRAQGWTFRRIAAALGVSAGVARWSACVHAPRIGLDVPVVAVVGADGHVYGPRS